MSAEDYDDYTDEDLKQMAEDLEDLYAEEGYNGNEEWEGSMQQEAHYSGDVGHYEGDGRSEGDSAILC